LRFTRAGDEDAGRAVAPFEVDGHIVLDLDLVIAAELAKAAHARGHPGQPLERVELVQTLIEEHAAAFAFPSGAPAAAGVVGLGTKPVGDDPVHADDRAELARLNELADLRVTRLGAKLEHRAEHLFGAPGRRADEPLRVRLVRGDRLLDHEVQARFQRVDALRGMLRMRRGHEHCIDGARLDELVRVVEHCNALRFEGLELVRAGAAHGSQFAARNFAGEEIIRMELPHVPHAEDAESDFIHAREIHRRRPIRRAGSRSRAGHKSVSSQV